MCGDYSCYTEIENSVIYADPPYENTTKYNVNYFDYEHFWSWCKQMSLYNKVFVSSYSAPNDFKCIWEKKMATSLDISNKRHIGENRVERLFTIN